MASKVNFEPNGDRYLVEFADAETTTKSGIVLTSSAQEKPEFAEIVAVGSGITDKREIKMIYKTGDKILVSKYAGNEIKLDGEEYTVVKQSEILGKVSK